VTLRDVLSVLQRTEMVMRIADEIAGYIVELGVDGRLVRLQLDEQLGGIEDDGASSCDYFADGDALDRVPRERSRALDTDELVDLRQSRPRQCIPRAAADLDGAVQPKGYRLLSKIRVSLTR
jgi:diadenylate cyclase